MRARGTVCQYGSGFNDYPVYRGVSRQYGNGLGEKILNSHQIF